MHRVFNFGQTSICPISWDWGLWNISHFYISLLIFHVLMGWSPDNPRQYYPSPDAVSLSSPNPPFNSLQLHCCYVHCKNMYVHIDYVPLSIWSIHRKSIFYLWTDHFFFLSNASMDFWLLNKNFINFLVPFFRT